MFPKALMMVGKINKLKLNVTGDDLHVKQTLTKSTKLLPPPNLNVSLLVCLPHRGLASCTAVVSHMTYPHTKNITMTA